MEVSVDLGNAADFFLFDYLNMRLYTYESSTDKETQPVFDIQISLSDDHPEDPLTKTYDITLIIVKDWFDPIEPLIEEAKKVKVINNYAGRVYDVTEISIEDLTGENSAVPSNLTIDYYVPKNVSSNTLSLL